MRYPFAGTPTLRKRLFLGSVSLVLVVMIGGGALAWIESTKRQEFYAATEAFLEEQKIAEEISHAVSRQVVAASLFSVHASPELMDEVREAGDQAYGLIRRYLFRDLTPEQRLKLEAVKEAHQRLEVAASRVFLEDHGPEAAGGSDDVPEQVVVRARALQEALDGFIHLRESDVEELRSRQATVFRGLHLAGAGLALVLLGIAIAFAGFVHRRVAGPLTELAAAADRIEKGDLSVRVELAHDDELASVGESFNGMVDTLARARERLEAKNRELAQALEKLRETQADLVQTEKLGAVGEMMAGLAHELNNPLASILGYGRLLEEELEPAVEPSAIDEIRDRCVRPLVDEASRARELVRSLLRFSRQSDGALVPVKLDEALQTVERLRVYSFEQAGLELEIAESRDSWVRAEPQSLQQVFLNLMNNALEAMEERGHGKLRVETEVVGTEVRLTFADDGPGFPDPDRAFDPFVTTKAAGKGTGLGLSLVHRFIREFGGTVRAYNAPSGGARVQVSLHQADPPPDRTPSGSSAEVGEGELFPGDRDAAGATVLVVEDEAPLRRLHQRVLEKLNARVLMVETGEAARALLEEREVDLVISDVKMPGAMSGLDLFRWLEGAHPELRSRFLFVTGDTEQAELSELAARLPGQVIEKPFEMDDYVKRILSMLAPRRESEPSELRRIPERE